MLVAALCIVGSASGHPMQEALGPSYEANGCGDTRPMSGAAAGLVLAMTAGRETAWVEAEPDSLLRGPGFLWRWWEGVAGRARFGKERWRVWGPWLCGPERDGVLHLGLMRPRSPARWRSGWRNWKWFKRRR